VAPHGTIPIKLTKDKLYFIPLVFTRIESEKNHQWRCVKNMKKPNAQKRQENSGTKK